MARDDKKGTAYIVRDAPADVVHDRPSRPPRSRPSETQRASSDVRRASRTNDSRTSESETGTSDAESPSGSPSASDEARPSPHHVPVGTTPASAPRAAPRHSTIRPKPRTDSHDPRTEGGASVRAERVLAPPIDARGTDRPPPIPMAGRSAIDQAEVLVRELCSCEPGGEHVVLSRLHRLGDAGLSVLVKHFPGPLWFNRRRPHQRLPAGRHVSAIASALVSFGDPAVPFVAWLLGSSNADVRYYAALIAGDLPHDDLLEPLGRLALHPDASSRAAALIALSGCRALPGYESLLGSLRSAATSTVTAQAWRVRGIHALRELRDAGAVPSLVEALGDKDRTIARTAHVALRTLTAHDFGSMRMAWSRWYKSQGSRPRVLWLIEGLADRRPDLRELATNEVVHLTGDDLTAPPEDAEREEFLAFRERCLAWWERTQRRHFG